MAVKANWVRLANQAVRKGLRRLGLPGGAGNGAAPGQAEPYPSAPAGALGWVRRNELPTGGIRVHSGHADSYPEVTGYLLPTLLDYGERALATRLARWLLCIQRADGSYTSPEGVAYVFDTGQVLRGLLAGADLVPGMRDAARRAADYLCGQMRDGGRGGFGPRYPGDIPETVHLYALPPLVQAAEVLGKPEYAAAAQLCREYYSAHPDALRLASLTHFLAYELEALIDLGCADRAAPVLEVLAGQQPDGSVRGVEGARWVCAPGLAQLAICWYKTGHAEPADRALAWLEGRQRSSGGFRGSYGRGATYFPDDELSWAAKFYLDAHRLRVQAFFRRHAAAFPATVAAADGRAQAVLAVVRPTDRVLEVGCGKGRFLKVVRQAHPGTQCTGVDLSEALLAHLPPDIQALPGSLEAIPCADNAFDVVFAVEAVEHSANPEAAVAELIRVARPGGWVLVIDKERSQWGRLACPSWEHWPEAGRLRRYLNRGCDHVSAEPVGYDGRPPADGLMVVWRGQKRSRLSGREWNQVLLTPAGQQALVQRVRHNHLTEWSQVVHLWTAPGEKVLEIGSGTGEISLQLAQAGRRVTALDLSADNLEFTRRCADELGVPLRTVAADATQPLPFADNEFDCVWQSGLLEHFTPAERRAMLKEWVRVTSDRVLSLVPNAASVAYRAGKAIQEENGAWPYGIEVPLFSLKEEFEAVGLQVVAEYSIAAAHALSFLAPDHALRRALSTWLAADTDAGRGWNQGYLLVTVSRKAAACGLA
jgi:malonyl-CoA O-methyltransferase